MSVRCWLRTALPPYGGASIGENARSHLCAADATGRAGSPVKLGSNRSSILGDKHERRWARARAINAHATNQVHLLRRLASRNRNIDGREPSRRPLDCEQPHEPRGSRPCWHITKAGVHGRSQSDRAVLNSALGDVDGAVRAFRAAPFVGQTTSKG
jgi:hypothetical protein